VSLSISTTTIPEQFLPLFDLATVAFIATSGPAGDPQASPVWFDWDGDIIRFAVTPETQKLKNMRRDPRIAFTIVDPENNGRYIEIRGTVTITLDQQDEIGNRLARKYLKLDRLPWAEPNAERWILTLSPTRIITHES
jgi:PPOX class probable F420-dependent enzyme